MKRTLIKSPSIIPTSRLRRELKKWMRWVDKNPNGVIFITHNRIIVSAMVSPSYYKKHKCSILIA